MRSVITILLFGTFILLNTSIAQTTRDTSHPFSKSWVISGEGGINIGATDFPDTKMDYFGRGSIEYFLPTSSSSVFGARVFGGAGYVAGKGNPSNLPIYANINEFRTKIVYGGVGLIYSLSLGKVVQPYLFAGVSYLIFNPLKSDGTKMPRNSLGEYADNDKDYMGEFGIRFLVSDFFSFNAGYTFNYFINDNIDDVFNSKNDAFHSLFAGISYYFSSSTDSDGDGVKDSKDICNDTPAGVSVDEFGCPIDSDNDKVPDYIDKCLNTPVNVAVDSDGCPVDSDNDGVPDYLDKCPETDLNVKVDEKGCEKIIVKTPAPEVKQKELEADENLKLVLSGTANFQLGKSDLLPNPISGLDKLSEFILNHPDTKWVIEGHTDNRGKDADNEKLSLERAKSVLDYFVKKGLSKDRFEVIGAGSSKPIADNSIEFGRSLNRRVLVEEKNSFYKRNKVILAFKTDKYDFSKEINIESLIFTDSKYYCIQVSAWKTKLKAVSELEKLIAKGHSAFVIEAQPNSNNEKWYQVRIGYFGNLEDAREYLRRIR